MSAPVLRVGVVGLGVGRQHLEAFARHPECSVLWAADLAEDALSGVRSARPGIETTRSAEELLNADLDAVVVASFDDVHAEQVVAALDRELHVFAEKPICRTSGELAAVRAAASRHPELVVTSNLVLREGPLWRRLRAEVASGVLGRVYAIDGDYLYGRLHKITEGWRGEVDRYSVMVGGGVHMVDLMLLLLGERPTHVLAAGSGVATEGTAFEPHDFTAATYRFNSGAVGRITANFGCVHRHQHVVRIFGTEATVIVDDQGARRYRTRDPGDEPAWLSDAPLAPGKGALVPRFVDAMRGRESGLPGLDHELAVIEACLAADASAETGQVAAISQGKAGENDLM